MNISKIKSAITTFILSIVMISASTMMLALMACSCNKSKPMEPIDIEVKSENEENVEMSEEDETVPASENEEEEESECVDLGKGYNFYASQTKFVYSEGSPEHAAIVHNGQEVASFEYTDGGILVYIGNYDGKFYFNYTASPKALGVYTYTPGESEFEKVCDDLNLEYFEKEGLNDLWSMRHAGVMDDRYILAVPYYPTDGYNGYGTACVYDLKTDERTELGTARDIVTTDDKIFWTDTDPYDFGNADYFNIIVKEASADGSNINTIKTIPVEDAANIHYGAGYIDRRNVKWSFIKSAEKTTNVSVNEVYRNVEDNYKLRCDLEVKEEPSEEAETKKRIDLSEDGQKNALPGENAVLKEGTVVTCLSVKGDWMEIPSGWINYRKAGEIFVSLSD